ncbi:unnamed protein product [Closterium sp. Naga37s-1]|nr:unnamed protein product [Closterium sp. Naga37s-1]
MCSRPAVRFLRPRLDVVVGGEVGLLAIRFASKAEALLAPVAAPLAPVHLGSEPPAPMVTMDPPAPVAAPPVPAVPAAPPATVVPSTAIPAVGSSTQAVSANTGGQAPAVGLGEAVQSALVVQPPAPAGQQRRPLSPDRRPSRPHSPAPREEQESSRRRHDSPRHCQTQANWPTHRGGRGGCRGGRGRGGGGSYVQPLTLADVQRIVMAAMHEERPGQASQSSSLQAALAPVALPPTVIAMPAAAPPPPVHAPSAPVHGSRLRIPWVPPVAGMEFVASVGGVMRAEYPPLIATGLDPSDADDLLPFLVEAILPPQTRVPEATLGQLFRLVESLWALLLIQVLAHASLPLVPADSLLDRPRENCLDAADQLALLLVPMLAVPAKGGAAAYGQLDEDV